MTMTRRFSLRTLIAAAAFVAAVAMPAAAEEKSLLAADGTLFEIRAGTVVDLGVSDGSLRPDDYVIEWTSRDQDGSIRVGIVPETQNRNVKRNLRPVDIEAVLAKVVAMPVYHWQPKEGPNRDVEHLGPMAQDFMTAFGLGDNNKAIGFQDADGVALAAIQGLHQLVEQKDAELKRQDLELTVMKRKLEAIEAKLGM